MTVSLRPYYLPREFSHVVCSTIYIPNRSVAKQGANELCSAIHDIERSNPDALVIINGDFNHASLKKSSVQYHQYVNCPTRGTATLDLFYSNVKGAYTASPLSQLGQADHNLVFLLPKYRPLVQRQKPKIVSVQQWNRDSLSELQALLECTDWNVFIEANPDLNDLVDVVSSYTNFCTKNAISTKEVKIYPNNKPWVTKEAKDVINRKKQIFGQGDKMQLKGIQKELKRVIKAEKAKYKNKIEKTLTQNNMKKVWEGMRLMSARVGIQINPRKIDNYQTHQLNMQIS